MAITQPLLLQPGIATSINLSAYSSCGCFFFLEAEQVQYPQPSSYYEAFVLNIVQLYTLYKDCGRGFLALCLTPALMPPGDGKLNHLRNSAESHCKKICDFMRGYYCHGNFKNIDFRNSNCLLDNKNISKMSGWLSYTRQNTPDYWENQYKRLCKEADNLHLFLENWISAWQVQPSAEKKELVRKFVFYSLSGTDTQKSPSVKKSALEKSLDMQFLSPIICRLYKIDYEKAKEIYNDHFSDLVHAIRAPIIAHHGIPNFYKMIVSQVLKTFEPPALSSLSIFRSTGLLPGI